MTLYTLDHRRPSLAETAYVAPTASVIGDVHLGEETSVWFGAVIRGDNMPIHIGARTNIQDGTIGHSDEGFPLTIGDDVTVGHRAIIHGCTIGNGVLIGMGATILNGAVIGDGSIVGAGALVTENKVFEPGQLIVGVPARAIRAINEEDRQKLLISARHYADLGQYYRERLSICGG